MMFGRIIRFCLSFCLFMGVLWCLGLGIFVTEVTTLEEPRISSSLQPTDAIVVLTGGSERVSAGIELLKAGVAKKLFISGVYQATSTDHLTGIQSLDKDQRACCVILGHVADSTLGNAEETLAWAKKENIHSVRLVTANYHMPRSLLIFQTAMPNVTIIPYPVTPDNVKLLDWWQRPGTAHLLATEYTKYLYALLRTGIGL